MEKIKAADSFDKRVMIASEYFERIVEKHSGSLRPVEIVTEILNNCSEQGSYSISIESLAQRYGISSRTLQRYFEATTSITSKQALQIMRIRRAVEHLASFPDSFHFSNYGYYDYSHFYKHLKQFLNQHTIGLMQPHLKLLRRETAL